MEYFAKKKLFSWLYILKRVGFIFSRKVYVSGRSYNLAPKIDIWQIQINRSQYLFNHEYNKAHKDSNSQCIKVVGTTQFKHIQDDVVFQLWIFFLNYFKKK